MRLLVFCAPDTDEAAQAFSGHEVHLILDMDQELNGMTPSSVLLLNFMRKQDLNAILSDLPRILTFAHGIEDSVGKIDRVISFNEATNYAAAAVRDELSIEGDSKATAVKFRDKWVMAEIFRKSGIPAPETRLVVDPESASLDGLADSVIVKPRDQAASRGVFKSRRDDALRRIDETGAGEGVIVQDFIDGDFYHFDVAYRSGIPEFIGINRYIHHGMDWASGQSPMASVTETDVVKIANATDLLERVGVAFDVGDRVLHIEAFWTGSTGFLLIELASRPGGALIVPAHEAAGGPNLEMECIRQQVRDPDHPRPICDLRYSAEHGWIVTPLPGFGPFVVTGDNVDRLELNAPPALATVPAAGTVLHDRYRYRNPQGKFIFLGPESAAQISRVAADYHLDLVNIEVGTSDYWLG